MPTKTDTIIQLQLKKDLPEIKPGDTVRVYQKIKETPKKGQEAKERIQVFEGEVLAKKHGGGIEGTITVRKVVSGVGVERIFPIHSPSIEKIEPIRRGKARRAKLYYLRGAKGKKAKLKRKEIIKTNPQQTEEAVEANPQQ